MAKSTPRHYTQGTRAQTAEATGTRIVGAFLARLMKQWYDEITLDRVAEDAGVTVQTVVRRFGGKEGLLAEAVNILGDQINERRSAPIGDLERVVENLVEDYEQIGDTIIRLLALEPRHPVLEEFLGVGRRWHRQWVASMFENELPGLDASARGRAIDALVIVTDVYTWKLLRRDMGRTISAVRATIKRIIGAVLSEFSN